MTTAPRRSPGDSGAESASIRTVLTKVFVTGLRVEARIGVYGHEQDREQPLIIDAELDVPTAGAEHLVDTVNYETIAQAARDIVAEGHIGLVETFAERLARACLADPRVTRARIRVDKPQALAPQAAGAGVEITVVRN
jgi:dihydroneopterin aldolase